LEIYSKQRELFEFLFGNNCFILDLIHSLHI